MLQLSITRGSFQINNKRPPPPCKCGVNCPVGGQCTKVDVVYEAKIRERTSQNVESYTGLTFRPFKTRYKEHLYDMAHPDNRTSSKLAGHIWNLKDKGEDFDITWKILAQAPSFNPVNRKCMLCLKEKHFIMYKGESSSLNKRSEIFNTCRHRLRDLLVNVKS